MTSKKFGLSHTFSVELATELQSVPLACLVSLAQKINKKNLEKQDVKFIFSHLSDYKIKKLLNKYNELNLHEKVEV